MGTSAQGRKGRVMAKDYSADIDLADENDPHTKLVLMAGTGRNVLDVGCSYGHVAAALKERGCTVTGIELDAEAASKAQQYCERVIIGDLDTMDLRAELGPEKFDVALFGDVLEHLKNAQRLLSATREALAPGGFIGVSVPNVAHGSIRLKLLMGDFDYENMGILDDTHLKYYTRKSICDLLESCGFMVEVIDWVEKRLTARVIHEVLDPLGLGNLEEVIKSLSTWEAVAYQYVIKAFPASEEAQVKRLSEEKVQAERRLRELEDKLAGQDKIQDDIKKKDLELEKVGEYAKLLEGLINEKDAYIKSLEAALAERDRMLAQKQDAPEGRQGSGLLRRSGRKA